MQRQLAKFTNDEGQQLSGLLDLPREKPIAYALFAHCFTCSKNLKAARHISAALNAAGIGVLRFDFTGLGQSEGEFSDTNFSTNTADLKSAAAFLEEKFEGPALLVGHSLGGTAVLQAAQDIPTAVAVVTIGSPSRPSHVAELLEDSRTEIESSGQATVNLDGRRFVIREQFLKDLERHDLPGDVRNLRKALLILHAPLDDTVKIACASELFQQARHPKSFVSLDKADHLLSNEDDSLYAGRVIGAWASRYLSTDDEFVEHPGASDSATIARTPAAGFRTDITSAGHRLVADEPANFGGTNLGPSPYDLLSAALASCTTMTIQLYARRKKIDLREAMVTVSHSKIHAKDCEDCESKAGKIDEFQSEVHLDGDLDAESRQKLLEIATKCPVHRTLQSEVKIRTLESTQVTK